MDSHNKVIGKMGLKVCIFTLTVWKWIAFGNVRNVFLVFYLVENYVYYG